MEELSRQGQKASTHLTSGVRINVGVGQRCRARDVESSTLQAKKWSVTFHRGDGTLHMGSIRGKAHILPDNTHSNGQHFSGAMEDMSRQGKKASTQIPLR